MKATDHRGRHWNRRNTKRRDKKPDLLTKIMRDGNGLDKDLFNGFPRQFAWAKTWHWFNRLGLQPYQEPVALPF